ncbi:aryl-sulfate sulfotransferase [Enterococcus sp. UD-01]|jgi:arylsulfate sulfotransferase|uniref:aryl-sulfate sulfotransferase n=1 Tax=Enterococcus sp. UD-01 TaxID=3373911 RepID=UPI0038394588
MRKKLPYTLPFFLLLIFSGCQLNDNGTESSIHLEQLSVETLKERKNVRTLATQNDITNELETLKEAKEYSFAKPLAVWNPYQTIANSLYLAFELEEGQQLTYTIQADGYADFSKTAKQTDGGFLLLGFIPSTENILTLQIKDATDSVVKEQIFSVVAPDYEYTTLQLKKASGTSDTQLSNGLFALIGAGNGHTFLFDNSGVIRGDILTNSYRTDRIIQIDDQLLFANTNNQIVRMNALGKFEALYKLSGYELHHDFCLANENSLLILASKKNRDTVEDIVLTLDLTTGECKELIDMKDLLFDYVSDLETEDQDEDNTLDWLHANSIQVIDENQLILSSRETSSIIKINNVYTEPTLEYIIGEEDVWTNTTYKDHLLTQVGNFPNSGGQHSVNYLADDKLKDGQYYLYFYNNNLWWYASNPDYTGSIPTGTGEKESGEKSKYYKYLIDEEKGTYELVDSFDLPYSSIVSNVQSIADHLVINSGYNVHLAEEYTQDGELITSFDYSELLDETEKNLGYRVFKYSFDDFWFTN